MILTDGNVVSIDTLKKDNKNEKLKAKCEAILKIFGSSGADKEDETGFGPTRVSFADCYLDDDWQKMANNNRWLLTEEKSENVINRIKGTAEHPRFIERVPACVYISCASGLYALDLLLDLFLHSHLSQVILASSFVDH